MWETLAVFELQERTYPATIIPHICGCSVAPATMIPVNPATMMPVRLTDTLDSLQGSSVRPATMIPALAEVTPKERTAARASAAK